jgi:hypothetical protein
MELVEPVRFVRPNDEVGSWMGSDVPDSGAIKMFGVGFNPDAGTELQVVGWARGDDDGPNLWVGLHSRQDASEG